MRLSQEPLISEPMLETRIAEMAEQISHDCSAEELLVLVVLKGGILFAADLIRKLQVPVTLDFLRARSYDGAESKGTVAFPFLPGLSLQGRAVLVVEDILDTGRTSTAVMDWVRSQAPEQLALATLLDKPSRRVVDIEADYTGFTIEDHFVVGYGLDYEQQYRALPAIYTLDPDA